MIWKNANPEYEEIAETLQDQTKDAPASKIWNWGKISGEMKVESEVWEDEVGSFKADVYDNCNNKGRYLTLKRKAIIERARQFSQH